MENFKNRFNKLKNKVLNLDLNPSPILAFLSQERLLDFSEKLTVSAADIYDKALDAEYLKTHIGGANHRIFDGGHDVFNAWEAVRDASPNDSFNEEVAAYFTSLWKDLNTSKGLPFISWEKGSYDKTANWLSEHIPYSDKNWVYDLFSYDSFEILASSLSIAAALFALKRNDLDNLAELLGSAGVISIISANPLLGILMILTAAYAYFVKKKKFMGKDFSEGIFISTVSMSIFSVLGISIFFELIIVIVVTKILRDYLNKEVYLNDVVINFYQDIKSAFINGYNSV